MAINTLPENGNVNDDADDTSKAIKRMSDNISRDINEYMDSINFTDEQKNTTRRIVCQFVYDYIISDLDNGVVVNAIEKLMVETKSTDFGQCCDIIYRALKYIPNIR